MLKLSIDMVIYNNDINFKLRQSEVWEGIVKFLEISCNTYQDSNSIVDKVFVETHYDEDLFASEIDDRENEFLLNELETSVIFSNFYEHLTTLVTASSSSFNTRGHFDPDDTVTLKFKIQEELQEELKEDDEEKGGKLIKIKFSSNEYESETLIDLSNVSRHAKNSSRFNNCQVQSSDSFEGERSIDITMKYINFLKIFKILKCKGSMTVGVSNNESLALKYNLDDCCSASIFLMWNRIVE